MLSHQQSLRQLAKADPIMAELTKSAKLVPLRPRKDYFYALVHAIVNQQLSGKAAETIFARFVGLFPDRKFPEPKQVLKMSEKKMRAAGLSYQKISYIKNIARAVEQGTLELKKFPKMKDEAIIEQLTQIKGIGRWTAEMFLMFSLARPNVFSIGDLGLRNGLKKLYKIDAMRHHKKLQKLLDSWHPHKTLASRHLWASLE